MEALFAMKKKKERAQAQKKEKKEPSGQKPIDEVFPKEVVEPSVDAALATVVGGPKAEVATKKKKGDKGVEPPIKKQKVAGGIVGMAAPLIVIDDQPSADSPTIDTPMAQTDLPPENLPREIIQLSLAPGASVLHGSAEPMSFLRGITSMMDKQALPTYDDDALESKALRSSLAACITLGEQARRREEWRRHKAELEKSVKELIHDKDASLREVCKLEDALRQAELKLKEARDDGKAEGKAEAERVAAEERKQAAEDAEKAKAEAVVKAREEAIAGFISEGWKAEGQREWVASVVKASIEEWVKGPGLDWMNERGDTYYQAGEFFTQHLVYRRLARHFGTPMAEFDPSVYGLPPLQPDVRVPLPEGGERPVIHDSMMMSGDDDGATVGDSAVEEEISSKPAAGAVDEVADKS
ncbi:unnamed protein product [Cuscuta europaea]|uniref:Uncharacterized protein n=1 Tax=Cuscuta europaea TaxID=41803 RepID=A0A9P1E350_CUSEU|nr:unnamed protein product [Cuscuta europaea]